MDGIAILSNAIVLFGTKKTRFKAERNIETAICRSAQTLQVIGFQGRALEQVGADRREVSLSGV